LLACYWTSLVPLFSTTTSFYVYVSLFLLVVTFSSVLFVSLIVCCAMGFMPEINIYIHTIVHHIISYQCDHSQHLT